jgi:hypothetical protein
MYLLGETDRRNIYPANVCSGILHSDVAIKKPLNLSPTSIASLPVYSSPSPSFFLFTLILDIPPNIIPSPLFLPDHPRHILRPHARHLGARKFVRGRGVDAGF